MIAVRFHREVMRESDESFELDTSEEAELLLSLAEADRGEFVSAEDALSVFRDAE
jgi:hypothetical protein